MYKKRELSAACIFTSIMVPLSATPVIVILIYWNRLGELNCWINSENDLAFPIEQFYEGETNEADKWRAWFLASTILYGTQLFLVLSISCTGFICFKKAYYSLETFYCLWIFTPLAIFLTNLGFNIWATVIRFNSSGRKCAGDLLHDTGHFMTVWVSVTYGT